jgi:hypothetical protein
VQRDALRREQDDTEREEAELVDRSRVEKIELDSE